jgi:type II secretory pathway component GspD/PulD (secretin)
MKKEMFLIGICLALLLVNGKVFSADNIQPAEEISSATSRLEKITPTDGNQMPPGIRAGLSTQFPEMTWVDPQIRSFLKTIAEVGRLDIVASQEIVETKLSIFLGQLKNITVGDLLEIALINNDLGMEIKGNIINVMSAARFQQLYGRQYNENRQLKIVKLKNLKPSQVAAILKAVLTDFIGQTTSITPDEASQNLIIIAFPERMKIVEEVIKSIDIPLETKVFEPKHAKASTIEALFTRTGMLTPVGTMRVDDKTNKLFITDTTENLNDIDKLIRELDVKPRQVMIEARMVQVQLNDTYYLGVEWEKVFSTQSAWKGLHLVGKYPFPVAIDSKPSDTLTATVGTIPPDNFTTALKALSMFGSVRTISSPRLATQNNELAKFMVGSREAYVTTTVTTTQGGQSVAENVQFLDVGIELVVTPTINADNYISMHIVPEISSVINRVQTSQGNPIPIIQTTNVDCTVMIKDGITIVIAGLIRDEDRESKGGIPIAKDIPLIGPMFRQTGTVKIKTETVIFLTPFIISGDADASWMTKQREIERPAPQEIREIK